MSLADIHSKLDQFETITLDQMDRVKLMNRVDTKFNFKREQLLEILPELSKHYYVLEIEGNPTPKYESLYFDDDDLSFYMNHHSKRMNRYKVRIRKYLDSDIAFLEVKHKFKGRTNKMRIPVDDISHDLEEEHKEFLESTGVNPDELKPVLTNEYHRMTLVGKELNERLTLDLFLSFNWEEESYNFNELIIAELKQEKVSRKSPFFQIMKQHNIRPFRLSKYCIGVIKIFGQDNVKYNRFKSKLQKLQKIDIDAA